MGILHTNNAYSVLQNSLTPADLTIQVAAGDGAKFPNPAPGDYFLVTLENAAGTAREICKITARVGDVLTVDAAGRGFDDTTGINPAGTWMSGQAIVDHRPTAHTFNLSAGAVTISGDLIKNSSNAMGFATGEIIFTSVAGKTTSSIDFSYDAGTKTLFTGENLYLRKDGFDQGFKVNSGLAANVFWELPAADGTAGQVLKTDGAGILSWGMGGGTITKDATDTATFTAGQVIYSSTTNKTSAHANFVFDSATEELVAGQSVKVKRGAFTQGFASNAALAANVTWTLPAADGTAGQVLKTNGAGALSWGVASGGITHNEVTVALAQAVANATFTGIFSAAPVAGSVAAFVNGVRLPTAAFNVAGTNMSVVDASMGFTLSVGDIVQVSYSV